MFQAHLAHFQPQVWILLVLQSLLVLSSRKWHFEITDAFQEDLKYIYSEYLVICKRRVSPNSLTYHSHKLISGALLNLFFSISFPQAFAYSLNSIKVLLNIQLLHE